MIYRDNKKIVDLSYEEFEERFKIFTRFLKDNGYYCICMKYLFPDGRTKRKLYDETICGLNTYFCYDFSEFLNLVPCLGKSFKTYGIAHYKKVIEPIRQKWTVFYRKKYIDW